MSGTNRVDDNGLLYIFQRIKGLFVQKETGKGLSTNDYTTEDKTKLGNIAAGAQVNTIEGVQRNGNDLTPASGTKKVNVEVPVLGVQRNGSDLTPDSGTKKVNVEVPVLGVQRNGTDLTPDSSSKKVNVQVPVLGIQRNGTDLTPDANTKKVNVQVPVVDSSLSGSSANAIQNSAVKNALDLKAPLASPTFTGTPAAPTAAAGTNTTQVATTAFVATAIANALSGKIDLHFSFLEELPATGVVGTFYFIPAAEQVSGVDEWEEYVWNDTDSQFERVGAATVDLTDYFNTTNLPALTNAEIDTIVAAAMA